MKVKGLKVRDIINSIDDDVTLCIIAPYKGYKSQLYNERVEAMPYGYAKFYVDTIRMTDDGDHETVTIVLEDEVHPDYLTWNC